MNLLLRKALFVALGASVLFAAGCRKKPVRPDPSATAMGMTGTGALNPGGMQDFTDLVDDPSGTSTLEQRSDDVYEDDDMIRGLLQPVYFAFDQSAIGAAERTKVQEAATHLQSNPQHRLLLEGRCDWRGTAEYNLGLGDRRAAAVSQYLQSLGVAADKIETVSKGDLEAIENASADEMSRDRRVDIVILKR